jgi:hypothetical protein
MDMNKDIELYWSGVLSVTHESLGFNSTKPVEEDDRPVCDQSSSATSQRSTRVDVPSLSLFPADRKAFA